MNNLKGIYVDKGMDERGQIIFEYYAMIDMENITEKYGVIISGIDKESAISLMNNYSGELEEGLEQACYDSICEIVKNWPKRGVIHTNIEGDR